MWGCDEKEEYPVISSMSCSAGAAKLIPDIFSPLNIPRSDSSDSTHLSQLLGSSRQGFPRAEQQVSFTFVNICSRTSLAAATRYKLNEDHEINDAQKQVIDFGHRVNLVFK